MIPVSALIKTKPVVGAEQLERFNGFLAAKVLGNSLPNISTGETIKIVEEVAKATLPAGYELAWTGQAFQEKRTGSTSAIAFGFGIVMPGNPEQPPPYPIPRPSAGRRLAT